ncbi:MAG TPA: nucleoside-diphosphate kinase [Candidatus Nanoarchaeia archaeon]|nr:nucleoside diphosphate kinase [uncultured archaeon]
MDHVVVIVKPDGVKRALVGEIISRFEKVGLKIISVKMISPSQELVARHYPEDRTEFLKGMGEKTLKVYADYGKDPKEVFGTLDPLEIGRMINNWNIDFFTSGPVVALLLEGRHAVENARSVAGATMPVAAVPGTIRGDLATDSAAYANPEKRAVQNLVHVSGSPEEAKYEEDIWFAEGEKHSYKRADEGLV